MVGVCENLILNPPKYPIFNNSFIFRDYQTEAIQMVKESNRKNVVIHLPTGTGKNIVIIYSILELLKLATLKEDTTESKPQYLILVPRIILMEQMRDEFIKHERSIKNKIQLIGDGNSEFNENKLITICVFNSVQIVESYFPVFDKIYIDEAHHIYRPAIYYENDDDEFVNDKDENEDSDDDFYDDNEDEEDSEDELGNIKKYTQTIKGLVQYNNNVYLSATIDPIDDFGYYTQDVRTMIELNYLSDYIIHIPIFKDDPTNKNICQHLLKNYKNIIIYCNSQKEGKQ